MIRLANYFIVLIGNENYSIQNNLSPKCPENFLSVESYDVNFIKNCQEVSISVSGCHLNWINVRIRIFDGMLIIS